MPEYRLYHFKRGHIHRADSLTATDDLDAVKRAAGLLDGGDAAELWRGARKLKKFEQS
jgi:hypothetical protein